jgi:hypothetical protein
VKMVSNYFKELFRNMQGLSFWQQVLLQYDLTLIKIKTK